MRAKMASKYHSSPPRQLFAQFLYCLSKASDELSKETFVVLIRCRINKTPQLLETVGPKKLNLNICRKQTVLWIEADPFLASPHRKLRNCRNLVDVLIMVGVFLDVCALHFPAVLASRCSVFSARCRSRGRYRFPEKCKFWNPRCVVGVWH